MYKWLLHNMLWCRGVGALPIAPGPAFHSIRDPHPETWEWDGQAWSQVQTRHAPPIDRPTYGVYAPAFGGLLGITRGAVPSEGLVVYRYDGRDWTRLSVQGKAPPFTLSGPYWTMPDAVTYDASRKRVIASYNGSSAYGNSLYELVLQQLTADREVVVAGGTVTFRSNFPSQASHPWLLTLSQTDDEGIPVRPSPLGGYQVLPLDPDPLLLASLGAWMGGCSMFRGPGASRCRSRRFRPCAAFRSTPRRWCSDRGSRSRRSATGCRFRWPGKRKREHGIDGTHTRWRDRTGTAGSGGSLRGR